MFGFLKRKTQRLQDKCIDPPCEAEVKLEEAFRSIDSTVREKRLVRRSARMISQKAAIIPHLRTAGIKR